MAVISAVVPTLNAASTLPATLESLAAADSGRLRVAEVIVVDGGSHDGTADIAVGSGARTIKSHRGRGVQLAAGGRAAAADWLLFLHADTRLSHGWDAAAAAFIQQENSEERVAVFRFALDSDDPRARRIERAVAWRNRWLRLPYGDQGLLLHRRLYQRAGGYPETPLMEDVALVRRLGRRRIVVLDAAAVTSAARYVRGGFVLRPLRNLTLLGLFFLGVPPRWLARLYG